MNYKNYARLSIIGLDKVVIKIGKAFAFNVRIHRVRKTFATNGIENGQI